MGKALKIYILTFFAWIIANIADILILLGCGVLVTALFLYVNVFWGLIALSIILMLIGLLLSKGKT